MLYDLASTYSIRCLTLVILHLLVCLDCFCCGARDFALSCCIAPFSIAVALCLADFYGLHVSLLSLPDPPKVDSGIPSAYFHITFLTLGLVLSTFYSNGLSKD